MSLWFVYSERVRVLGTCTCTRNGYQPLAISINITFIMDLNQRLLRTNPVQVSCSRFATCEAPPINFEEADYFRTARVRDPPSPLQSFVSPPQSFRRTPHALSGANTKTSTSSHKGIASLSILLTKSRSFVCGNTDLGMTST